MKLHGDWEAAGEGVTRCLVELGAQIMAVRVRFELGAIGALHQHPHEQLTVVSSGRFRFQLVDTERIVETGDTVYIPSNVIHGVVTLQAGELLDIFTPLRLDMLGDDIASMLDAVGGR